MDIIKEHIEKTYLNNLLKYAQKNNLNTSKINNKLSETILIQTEVLTETDNEYFLTQMIIFYKNGIN